MEVVSILLAAGALVVSLAALYTTSIRGAEIGVTVELIGGEFGTGGATNWFPEDRLRLCLAVANTGAHGGLIEEIEFDEVEYIGEHPRLWEGVTGNVVTATDPHVGVPPVRFPTPVEAGDILMLYLHSPWSSSQDEGKYARDQAPVYFYAERLRGLREVRVVVKWTYRRVAGGWRSLLPGRGLVNESVTERTAVTVPGEPYIEICRRLWAGEPNYSVETAAILRGEEPPPRET